MPCTEPADGTEYPKVNWTFVDPAGLLSIVALLVVNCPAEAWEDMNGTMSEVRRIPTFTYAETCFIACLALASDFLLNILEPLLAYI